MTTSLSRRSVAKGAAWSTPALAVAAATPATASSCDPSTNVVNTSSHLTYSYAGSVVDGPGQEDAPSVTYVNNGPDPLRAGTVLTMMLVGSYDPNDATPTASGAATPSSATVTTGAGQPGTGAYAGAYEIPVTITLGADLATGSSLSAAFTTANFNLPPDTSTEPYSGSSSISHIDDTTEAGQRIVAACVTYAEDVQVTPAS